MGKESKYSADAYAEEIIEHSLMVSLLSFFMPLFTESSK